MPIPILFNPNAGALHAKPTPEKIQETAAEIALDVEVVPCTSADQMRADLKRHVADGREMVAIAGGDGTIAFAVQELAHSKTAMGIIPLGTANNFAKSLGLPQDLAGALSVLQAGRVRPIDLGQVNSRYFTEAAGAGLFADGLLYYGIKTGKSLPRLLYAVIHLFFSVKARRIKLTLDNTIVFERAMMCTVANAPRMALGVSVAPDALLMDGHLDVVVIGDLSRMELIRYFIAALNKTHIDLPKVSVTKAREIKIECGSRMRVHCDDQIIGTTPATISAEPGALRVVMADK